MATKQLVPMKLRYIAPGSVVYQDGINMRLKTVESDRDSEGVWATLMYGKLGAFRVYMQLDEELAVVR